MASNDRRSSPSGPKSVSKVVVTVDHGTVTNVTVSAKTFTVTGVRTTDVLMAANSVQKTGLGVAGLNVSAANECSIALVNPTAASITSGTVTYTLVIGRFNV